MSIHDFLRNAANHNETVRIIYRGGSHPGAARDIRPAQVSEHELIAFDVASGITKTFSIAKIQLPSAGSEAPTYEADQSDREISLREAIAIHLAELQTLGWRVELSDKSASLHRFFKNGKARRGEDVLLSVQPYTVTAFDDFDGKGLQYEERPSPRPFHVSVRRESRAYGSVAKAVLMFMDAARQLAPSAQGSPD